MASNKVLRMTVDQAHEYAKQELRRNIRHALTGEFSYTRGRLPQVWRNLHRNCEIELLFDYFRLKNMVSIEESPDDLSFDDLHGDMFDESHADTIPGGMRELKAQERRARHRVEMDGQWYVHGQYIMADGCPDIADGIGGFVGDDFWGSGYEEDLMLETMERMFEHYGMNLPKYFPSKTGAWAKACCLMWELNRSASA